MEFIRSSLCCRCDWWRLVDGANKRNGAAASAATPVGTALITPTTRLYSTGKGNGTGSRANSHFRLHPVTRRSCSARKATSRTNTSEATCPSRQSVEAAAARRAAQLLSPVPASSLAADGEGSSCRDASKCERPSAGDSSGCQQWRRQQCRDKKPPHRQVSKSDSSAPSPLAEQPQNVKGAARAARGQRRAGSTASVLLSATGSAGNQPMDGKLVHEAQRESRPAARKRVNLHAAKRLDDDNLLFGSCRDSSPASAGSTTASSSSSSGTSLLSPQKEAPARAQAGGSQSGSNLVTVVINKLSSTASHARLPASQAGSSTCSEQRQS